MKYEDFKKAVLNEMASRYPEADVRLEKGKANGGFRDILVILEGGQNACPAIYLRESYEESGLAGADGPERFGRACDRIAGTYTENRLEEPVDAGFFTDFGRVKGHIVPALVGCERNKEFLGEVPHRGWLDMALVLRARYDTGNGVAGIWVTDEHARMWGMSEEALFKAAMENAVRDSPPVLKGMGEVLAGLVGDEHVEVKTPMFVLSNREFSYGAAVLAYPGEVARLAARFPEGFYMLPSSIHELIIVPARDGGKSLPSYTKMVREVNSSKVDPGEQLSSHAYYYDAGEGRFVF